MQHPVIQQIITARLRICFAVALQRCCSSAAKALQWRCKGIAVALQRDCSSIAEVSQYHSKGVATELKYGCSEVAARPGDTCQQEPAAKK
ncbi:hypothetical protein [Bacteroides rodentium]|uniref:hypothetical protein n=1 Tax=Bacteroides rodentium TaxID=691816 RepID=UPI000471EF73|nr:hypothetical protein [Bacteroides rodentium]